MLIFNLEEDVMSLSINTEISRTLNISQCVEANHDDIFFLSTAKPKLVKSVCVQSKKGINMKLFFMLIANHCTTRTLSCITDKAFC